MQLQVNSYSHPHSQHNLPDAAPSKIHLPVDTLPDAAPLVPSRLEETTHSFSQLTISSSPAPNLTLRAQLNDEPDAVPMTALQTQLAVPPQVIQNLHPTPHMPSQPATHGQPLLYALTLDGRVFTHAPIIEMLMKKSLTAPKQPPFYNTSAHHINGSQISANATKHGKSVAYLTQARLEWEKIMIPYFQAVHKMRGDDPYLRKKHPFFKDPYQRKLWLHYVLFMGACKKKNPYFKDYILPEQQKELILEASKVEIIIEKWTDKAVLMNA